MRKCADQLRLYDSDLADFFGLLPNLGAYGGIFCFKIPDLPKNNVLLWLFDYSEKPILPQFIYIPAGEWRDSLTTPYIQ